jgi:hypothetical protein
MRKFHMKKSKLSKEEEDRWMKENQIMRIEQNHTSADQKLSTYCWRDRCRGERRSEGRGEGERK